MKGPSVILFFLFTFLWFFPPLWAQKTTAAEQLTFDSIQRQLQPLAYEILNGATDEERKHANERFSHELSKALALPNSFIFPFDSLKSISKLTSSDGKVRIMTWNLPHTNGTYHYFGFIQYRLKKEDVLIELADSSDHSAGESGLGILSADNWLGALYYKMITYKKGKNSYYTLLGWKGNNQLTTKKVIEVLSFDKGGQAEFGKDVFVMKNNRRLNRMVYEFSAEVSMSITYDESGKVIIADHLFPSNPTLEGHYEFYGPDLSFDAFQFKKGDWIFIEDYDPGLRPAKKEIKLKQEKVIYRN